MYRVSEPLPRRKASLTLKFGTRSCEIAWIIGSNLRLSLSRFSHGNYIRVILLPRFQPQISPPGIDASIFLGGNLEGVRKRGESRDPRIQSRSRNECRDSGRNSAGHRCFLDERHLRECWVDNRNAFRFRRRFLSSDIRDAGILGI